MPRAPKRTADGRLRDYDGVTERKDRPGCWQFRIPAKHPEGHERAGESYQKKITITPGEINSYRKLHNDYTAKTEDVVKAIRTQRTAEVGNGSQPSTPRIKIPLDRMTLRSVLTDYLADHAGAKDYRSKRRIAKVVVEKFGDRLLLDIMPDELGAWHKGLTAEGEDRCKRTANRYLGEAKCFIRWAVERAVASASSPDEKRQALAAGTSFLLGMTFAKKHRESNKGRIYSFTKAEVIALLDAAKKDASAGYMVPMILLAVGTGIRRGDLVKLRWRDVDEATGEIRVGGDTGDDTKGGSPYEVDLGGLARLGIEHARAWLDECDLPHGPDDPVLCVSKKWPGRDRLLWDFVRAWPRVRKAAKVPAEKSFHTCRHTFISWAVAWNKGDVARVRDCAGHHSVEMTNRYLHKVKDRHGDSVNPLDPHSDLLFRPIAPTIAPKVLHLVRKNDATA